MLKGSFTIFLFSVRSNILNSNRVWYSWFCPEGPLNASNSKFLVFYFAPRDLDSQRHMGPRLAAQGTLTHSAGDLDSRRHRFELKGSFTIFLFLVRSHILNSNGMWYSWFCPEGPINASNSKFLVFYFAPRDLDSQRHMGPWLAAQGTLTRSAGDLDSQRHRFPMALRVKVPCAAS